MQMYEVGGCVRDELLGIKSHDIDFSVVLPPGSYRDPYDFMVEELEDNHNVRIIRGKDGKPVGHEYQTARGIHPARGAVDYVLARKEGDYDGRRPGSVEIGTLYDDLARRDFTVNAIAKAADGSLIDPFNGRADINARIIRAVGDPFERLTEDALRALRALRFSVTKGFSIDMSLAFAMESAAVLDLIETKISDERKREELSKMFSFDTVASIVTLNEYPDLTAAVFAGSVSLDSTMKTRGKGK